jgi:hypothetical protein
MDLKSLDEKVVTLAELTHSSASANVLANLIISRKASIHDPPPPASTCFFV